MGSAEGTGVMAFRRSDHVEIVCPLHGITWIRFGVEDPAYERRIMATPPCKTCINLGMASAEAWNVYIEWLEPPADKEGYMLDWVEGPEPAGGRYVCQTCGTIDADQVLH